MLEGGDDLLEVVLRKVGLLFVFITGEDPFLEGRWSRIVPPSEEVWAFAGGGTTWGATVVGVCLALSGSLVELDSTRPPAVSLAS